MCPHSDSWAAFWTIWIFKAAEAALCFGNTCWVCKSETDSGLCVCELNAKTKLSHNVKEVVNFILSTLYFNDLTNCIIFTWLMTLSCLSGLHACGGPPPLTLSRETVIEFFGRFGGFPACSGWILLCGVFGNCVVLLQGFVFPRSFVDQTQVGDFAPTMQWDASTCRLQV